MTSEDETEGFCEELASKIDRHLIENLSLADDLEVSKNLPLEYLRLQTKHPKSIAFLHKYDSDPRKNFSRFYKEIFGARDTEMQYFESDKKHKKLYYENSTLKYLRFGFLTNNNAKVIKNLSSQSRIDWLKGSWRHLAMEFYLTNSIADNKFFDINLRITLGPLGESYKEYRQEIYNCINKSLGIDNNKSIEEANHSGIPLKEFKIKNKNADEVKKWIKDTLNWLSDSDLIDQLNSDLAVCFDSMMR